MINSYDLRRLRTLKRLNSLIPLIKQLIWTHEYCFELTDDYLTIYTGGHSDNEEIVYALSKNKNIVTDEDERGNLRIILK